MLGPSYWVTPGEIAALMVAIAPYVVLANLRSVVCAVQVAALDASMSGGHTHPCLVQQHAWASKSLSRL